MNMQNLGISVTAQSFQDHLPSKTILANQRALSPKDPNKMNVHSIVFPSVTNEWPFIDHLPSKTIISTERVLLCRRCENECADQSLPQHPRTAFSSLCRFLILLK